MRSDADLLAMVTDKTPGIRLDVSYEEMRRINQLLEPAIAVSDTSASVSSVMDDVEDELMKAMDKFPQWPSDMVHGAAVVAEEAGELVKACLEFSYEPQKHHDNLLRVRKEAIQTAAMAVRFLMNLKSMKNKPSQMLR
jgi:hypothetical protein